MLHARFARAGVDAHFITGFLNEPDSRIACRLAVRRSDVVRGCSASNPHDAKTWGRRVGGFVLRKLVTHERTTKALKIGRDRCVVAYGEIRARFLPRFIAAQSFSAPYSEKTVGACA